MTLENVRQTSNATIIFGDIISDKDFLLIDKEGVIYRNDKKIQLDWKLDWPMARIVSDDLFILIEGERQIENKDNTWIINNKGTVIQSFYIGEATNVILTQDCIIAAYSKVHLDTSKIFTSVLSKPEQEKLSSPPSISSEGLAVFDFEGNCLFRYVSDTEAEDFLPFMEIEYFLKKNDQTIYLLAHLFDGSVAVLKFSLEDYSLTKIIDLE